MTSAGLTVVICIGIFLATMAALLIADRYDL